MKLYFSIFFISIFFANFAIGQKIALLSSNHKSPILYTDSITVNQIKQGYFPVSSQNFDTLYANLKFLNAMLSERQRSKMQSFSLKAGSTVIEIERLPFAYGDRYKAVVITKIGNTTAKMELFDPKKSNKNNAKEIKELMNYVFTNNSYFKGPNEIVPVIAEVVVITDN